MRTWLYQIALYVVRLFWRATGGRHLQVFGKPMRITPETVFPSYRSHPLPLGSHKSRIVRYGDFVQMHALADFIECANRSINIVEVGAFHGSYAVPLGHLLRRHGGHCLAIEPHPASFKILRKNIRMNNLEDIVTCIQAGVADKAGEMWISDSGSESQMQNHETGEGTKVRVMPLADIIKEFHLEKVDLLLIDVEGAELPVLKSFPWNDLPLPKIFCELHPYAWPDFGYNGQDISAFLTDKGLRCIDMYFTEHDTFSTPNYIGPTVLIR